MRGPQRARVEDVPAEKPDSHEDVPSDETFESSRQFTGRRRRRKPRSLTQLQSDELVEATAQFIDRENWSLFVTLTTLTAYLPETLAKKVRKFIKTVENDDAGLGLGKRPLWRKEERLVYVCAWEPQRRGAWHLHLLLSAPGLKAVNRNWMAEQWNRLCQPRSRVFDVEIDGVKWLMTAKAMKNQKANRHLMGLAKVLPVESRAAVTKYCSKYVVKGGQIDICGLKPL